MPSDSYTPQPDSVAGRVCAFFKTHPEEELSSKDIALKFDTEVSAVVGLLNRCFETKLLKRLPRRAQLTVGAGERLAGHMMQAGPMTLPALPFSASPKEVQRKARRSPLPPLDASTLTVTTKKPPPKHTSAPGTDWPAVFSRLRVGQAIEDMPAGYYGAAAKAAQKWAARHNAKLELRKLPDGKCGIYRVQ